MHRGQDGREVRMAKDVEMPDKGSLRSMRKGEGPKCRSSHGSGEKI